MVAPTGSAVAYVVAGGAVSGRPPPPATSARCAVPGIGRARASLTWSNRSSVASSRPRSAVSLVPPVRDVVWFRHSTAHAAPISRHPESQALGFGSGLSRGIRASQFRGRPLIARRRDEANGAHDDSCLRPEDGDRSRSYRKQRPSCSSGNGASGAAMPAPSMGDDDDSDSSGKNDRKAKKSRGTGEEDDEDDEDYEEPIQGGLVPASRATRASAARLTDFGESVEGVDYPAVRKGSERPAWAPKWVPSILLYIARSPAAQLLILLPLYAVHLFIFSTKGIKLPEPLVPNSKKLFQSVGWDSVVGGIVAVLFLFWRKFVMKSKNVLPAVLESDNPPWRVPRKAKRKIGSTTGFLFVAYLASGYGAVFIEGILYLLAGYGVPLTIATTRAWKVLLGHLMWVYMGIRILRRLKPFFPRKGTWLRWKLKANWLWWAIGGYYVSALFFNFADVVNQLVLPASMFEEETVVSKLINPENKDLVAMAIGSIGPCISAPVFEEVLYRGFLLPALACFLPMWAAIPTSSVLFALHHLNPTSVLPLTVLGLIWAILYTKSRNLTVTILIHCMWNSRVFLGSLLGLGTFPDFE